MNTEALIELIKKAKAEYEEDYLVVAIPGFLSKKFIAYCAMREDLKLVLGYIDELTKKPSSIIKSSLTYSMLALYGKCFTDASKNNFPKLEPNSLFNKKDDFRIIHDWLMDLRHHFIAHRGKTNSEVGISFMISPRAKAGDPQIRFKQLKQISFAGEKLLEIKAVAEYLISELEKKIQKSGQKIHDGFFKLFSIEEMSLMVMNNTNISSSQVGEKPTAPIESDKE